MVVLGSQPISEVWLAGMGGKTWASSPVKILYQGIPEQPIQLENEIDSVKIEIEGRWAPPELGCQHESRNSASISLPNIEQMWEKIELMAFIVTADAGDLTSFIN